MIKSNTFKAGPRVKGNTAYMDFQTKSNRGSILLENGIFYKEVDGTRTEIADSSEVGNAAGNDTEVQINDSGEFGASSELTYVTASKKLTIGTGSGGTLGLSAVFENVSNPPTNAEMEAACLDASPVTGSTYILSDTDTLNVYLCTKLQTGTPGIWFYTAFTLGV